MHERGELVGDIIILQHKRQDKTEKIGDVFGKTFVRLETRSLQRKFTVGYGFDSLRRAVME